MMRSSVLGSGGGSRLSFKFLKIFLVIATTATLTSAARRRDVLLPVAPTPEALREIADAVGAATFEDLTSAVSDQGRPKAKELKTRAPEDDVEYQTYQGVMGRPGVDFPVLPSIPQTFFDCKKVATGYYADLETDCQVFHICDGGRKISFLCPNGTIFRQSNLICDWWFKVDCADSPGQYEESAEHLAEDQRKSEKSKKQPLPAQNFETIHTTHKRPQTNYASNVHTGHNHITDYKAEASFNSVAQSGVPVSDNFRTQEPKASSKPSPRSFQVTPRQDKLTPTNSRQYSSFEHTTKADSIVNDEDYHRKTSVNSYKYSPTRRTMLDYTDAATYRGSTQPSRNYKEPKETQVVAESASFANSRGRNNYYHFSSNYDNKLRSTVETSQSYSSPTAARTTRPTYTTTYIPGSKNYVEVTRSVSRSVASSSRAKSSPQTYDYSISTTAEQPSASTKQESKLYNFGQYNQSPTLSTPNNNNYRVTINESSNNRPSNSIGIQISTKEDNKNVTKPSFKSYWIPPVKTENVTFYAPTVPTVTPKAYNATTNRFLASNWYSNVESDVITTPQTTSYSSEPAVAEHAVDMLKTLEELEFGSAEPTTETEKFLGKRPGLFVPPSAGPNTLHSLAIYFATAVDNLVSTPYPTTVTEEIEEDLVTEEETIPEENRESFTSLLSQKTLDKYTNLFKNSSSSESDESNESDEIANNDLESSQSRGPLSSSPQIRELAQVFTHALSAYLQDPETFRKVLSEIRPTDPTISYEPSSTTTAYTPIEETTVKSDFYSVVKDDEEVLDFSDVSKNSPHPTPTAYDTSITNSPNSESTKAYSVDLIKNRLLLTTSAYRHQTPIYYSNTKNKTPASSIITHENNDFDSTQNEIRQGKVLDTTVAPPTSNAVAVEINGGLSDTNQRVPQRFINGKNHNNCSESSKHETDSSYFPLDSEGTVKSVPRYGGFQNNSGENISPYGTGIKPSNSTPINGVYSGAISATEAIPLHWGDIISTKLSTIPDNPSAPSFDLTPPSKQFSKLDSVEMSVINSFIPEDLNDLEINNKTEEFSFQTTEQPQTISTLSVNNREHVTFKYRSHSADRGMYYNSFKTSSDNEEQLQRAQSQSFVASANQIGRRGKKIENQSRTNKNDNANSDKPSFNPTVTLRTSNGVILSLPTLKDILSKPISTVPTEPNTTEMSTIVSSSDTPTTVTVHDTTVGTTKIEETTPSYESSTTIEYSNPSTKASNVQISSTSQENIWSTSAALGQIWQTTVFLDPITINDGLSSDTERELILPSANTYIPRGSTQGWRYFSDKTYEPSTLIVTEQTEALSDLNITTTSGSFETSKLPETTIAPEETTTINTLTYEKFPPTYSGVVDNEKSNLQISKPREEQLKTVSFSREGKSLSTSASPNLILERLNASDVDQTMMNKAKEMFGGLNASSANTLMNVMKKADKNTTVRRLILLLVQTCDDDHNKTIEASRAALLDALMRIPSEQTEPLPSVTQNPLKDETEIVGGYEPQEITTTDFPSYSVRRSDEIIDTDDTKYPVSIKLSSRKGKQLDIDSTYPSTVQEITSTDQSTTVVTEPSSTTLTEAPVSTSTSTTAPIVTVKMTRRGHRKYFVKTTKTTKTPIYSKQIDDRSSGNSVDKGTVSSVEDQSVPSDTRALELLRSLYSLAARWG